MNNGKLDTVHVINEINDLQFDLQQWFRGKLEDFSIITSRQAPDLTVISSQGLYETRSEFNTRYEALKGNYPDVEMTSDILRTKRIARDIILVVYKQHSLVRGQMIERLTTAMFRYKEDLKNKAEWIHVHVTLEKAN